MKIIATLAIALAFITGARAYPKLTPAEIGACIGDALDLCIPDTGFNRLAIFRCLRKAKPRLSGACRAVFERHKL
jgi:hypothetical protein